jgi:predicted enzyme related to lactoylglutathione lyase
MTDESHNPTVRFDGLLIFCADVGRSAAFYTDLLGLQRDPADTGDVTLYLPTKSDPRGAWLLLHPAVGQVEPHPIGTFAVDDVDAVVARVRAAGHRVTEEPTDQPWGVRQAGIGDPDGYGLTLTTPLRG